VLAKPGLARYARVMRLGALLLISALGLAASGASLAQRGAPAPDWPAYGNAAGDRYSPLDQIDTGNVGKLEQVWRFDTGEGGLQTSPLMIDGVLYAATPRQHTIALDAATGRLIWEYAPEARASTSSRSIPRRGSRSPASASRARSICAKGWAAIRRASPPSSPRRV